MRAKMRAELDRSRCQGIRPEAGRGRAGRPGIPAAIPRPARCAPCPRRCCDHAIRRGCWRPCARRNGWMRATCDNLRTAHSMLLDAGLRCRLDRRPRITAETDAIASARGCDSRGLPATGSRVFLTRLRDQGSDSRSRTSPAMRVVSRNGSTSKAASTPSTARMRPIASRPSRNARSRPACASRLEHVHRRAGGAGFGNHVDRIGRAHDAVGPGEHAGIGILSVLRAEPGDAGRCHEPMSRRVAQFGGRASRRAQQQAAALACEGRLQLRRQHLECHAVEPDVPARAAEQHRGARSRQRLERGELRARLRQPQVVDRMQAAERGDHVATVQSVVARNDHDIPMPRIDARIEDLHHLAAMFAQQARGQCRLAAATDRDRRRGIQRATRSRRRTRAHCRRCGAAPARARASAVAIRRRAPDPARWRALRPGGRCRHGHR